MLRGEGESKVKSPLEAMSTGINLAAKTGGHRSSVASGTLLFV